MATNTQTYNNLIDGGGVMADTSLSNIAMVGIFTTSGIAVCLASISISCAYKIWKRLRIVQLATTTHPVVQPTLIIETIQPELRSQTEEEELCYVCTERQACTILLNCSHRGLCFQCTKTLIRAKQPCPLCRSDLTGLIHLLPNGTTSLEIE